MNRSSAKTSEGEVNQADEPRASRTTSKFKSVLKESISSNPIARPLNSYSLSKDDWEESTSLQAEENVSQDVGATHLPPSSPSGSDLSTPPPEDIDLDLDLLPLLDDHKGPEQRQSLPNPLQVDLVSTSMLSTPVEKAAETDSDSDLDLLLPRRDEQKSPEESLPSLLQGEIISEAMNSTSIEAAIEAEPSRANARSSPGLVSQLILAETQVKATESNHSVDLTVSESADPDLESIELSTTTNPDTSLIKRSSSSENSRRTPAQKLIFTSFQPTLKAGSKGQQSQSTDGGDFVPEPSKKRKRTPSSQVGIQTEDLQKDSQVEVAPVQPGGTGLPLQRSQLLPLQSVEVPADPVILSETSAESSASTSSSISASTTAVTAAIPKAAGPPRSPTIWTDNRQEIAESLNYFVNYQGGIYTQGASQFASSSLSTRLKSRDDHLSMDSSVFGYLVAGWGSVRDAFEEGGRVIISHGGGKSSGNAAVGITSGPGSYSLSGDQDVSSSSIVGLVNAMNTGHPLPLLVGDTYDFLPFSLNCGFAVLGWYLVTDAWGEKESSGGQSFIRWKFRFEYLESQGPPWWISDPEINPTPTREPLWNPSVRVERSRSPGGQLLNQAEASTDSSSSSRFSIRRKKREDKKGYRRPSLRLLSLVSCLPKNPKVYERIVAPGGEPQCLVCGSRFPQIYMAGWMCLSKTCPNFWKVAGKPPVEEDLTFCKDFLLVRRQPQKSSGLPFSLSPPQPDLNSSESHTSDALQGWHCLDCGRLNCRELYSNWSCLHCFNSLQPNLSPFLPPPRPQHTALISDAEVLDDKIQVSSFVVDNFYVTTYTLHLGSGSSRVHIVEALADDLEADGLLRDLQSSQVPFRRHPLGRHHLKGRLLCQQFTCNYGTPYKHLVQMSTIPFDQSPPVISTTLDLIRKRTLLAKVPLIDSQSFNELYPVLYLQSQSMHWHDDGQPGLGPIVSSLSLGSDAIMRFRLKETKSNVKSDDPAEQDERLLLQFRLRHGSIVIQDGAALQTYLEHSVEPCGERIAVTARYIDEEINRGKSKV